MFQIARTHSSALSLLRFLLSAGLPLLLVVTLLAGCTSQGADESAASSAANEPTPTASTAVPVRVETAEPTTFEDVIQFTGTVEAVNDAVISAETSGRIEMIHARGDWIAEGGVLTRINDHLLEAELKAAEARLDLARQTFKRQKGLLEDSVVSPMEFDQVAAELNQAQARVEQAREQLSNARPRAPFRGRVETRFVERGEFVRPGDPLMRIVDPENVQVVGGIPERYVNDIEKGTSARVTFKGLRDSTRDGRVTFVGEVINPDSRTVPVEIRIPNPNGRISPEMFASVALIRATLDSSITVPRTAVLQDERGQAVYVISKGDDPPTARRIPVTTGATANNRTLLTSGVEAGDRVVVFGQSRLTEGDVVQIVRDLTLSNPGPR